jgi:ERCC4-type nuclease
MYTMLVETKPTLLYDTREQLPYEFTRFSDQFAAIEKRKLLCGDYSILGWETQICFERKSIQDLVSTVIHGKERFGKELAKLREYEHAAIVIEASYQQVASPYTFSDANPKSVIGLLQSHQLRYGVHVIFAGTRVHAEAHIAGMLLKWFIYNSKTVP